MAPATHESMMTPENLRPRLLAAASLILSVYIAYDFCVYLWKWNGRRFGLGFASVGIPELVKLGMWGERGCQEGNFGVEVIARLSQLGVSLQRCIERI